MESNMELSDGVNSTNQNFTKKTEFFFCINVYKNDKEKLSIGFWVTKIKTDTAGARFSNSWCNHPPPITHKGKTRLL